MSIWFWAQFLIILGLLYVVWKQGQTIAGYQKQELESRFISPPISAVNIPVPVDDSFGSTQAPANTAPQF